MNITELPGLSKKFFVDDTLINSIKEKNKELYDIDVKSLLPFEQYQINKIKENDSLEISKVLNGYSNLDEKYNRIDMGFICKVRTYNKKLKLYVPRFAVYNMCKKILKMEITCTYSKRENIGEFSYETECNQRIIEDNYKDIDLIPPYIKLIRSVDGDKSIYTLSHVFSGIIPDDIRTIIKNAMSDFKIENLYLIEESYNWTLNSRTEKQVRNIDPVIVGENNGIFYYICAFDVTPIEKFISQEMVG